MLICIEGLTNSGKTTICKNLVSKMPIIYINDLLKNDVVTTNLAQITNPIANLDKFNHKTELLLYLSILSQKAYWINKLNNNKTILLVDRFTLSVYVQFCDNKDFDNRFIRDLVRFSANSITPDYTFFLDIGLDVIIERAKTSPFSRKDLSLPHQYEDMRHAYLENIAAFSKAYHIVNCRNGESSETLTSSIISLIKDF